MTSFVVNATCLGVQLDNNLSWSPHIKSLCTRFSAKRKNCKHLKGLNNRTLQSIYFSGIFLSITYCISLWRSSNSLQVLEEIPIRAPRYIFNIKDSTRNVDVLAAAKWKSLSYIYKKRFSCITYQEFYDTAPDGINSLFIKHFSLRNRRNNLKLHVQLPNSNSLRYSFSQRASILWNNLPVFLKNKPSLKAFKHQCFKNKP